MIYWVIRFNFAAGIAFAAYGIYNLIQGGVIF